MNVKVENQNLIQFPQVDWKSSKRSGEENHAMAVRESFGEILEREFQVHSEKPKSPSEYKTPGQENGNTSSQVEIPKSEDPTKQTLNAPTETKKEESIAKDKTSEEETEEITEEEDLDKDALEYSLGIVSSHVDWDRSMVSANQLNEMTVKEKTVLLSLQKSAEKSTAYSPKEGNAFIDEAKKLAESFFLSERTQTNASGSTKSQMPMTKDSNLVPFPKSDKKSLEDKKTNQKPISFGTKMDQSHSGSQVSDLVFAKGKEVKVEGKDLTQEQSVRKPEVKSKSSKLGKNESETTEVSSDQDKSNQTQNADKMIRSLGVKDKEFQKQDSKSPSALEKQKSTEATLVPNIQTATSSKSGEEGGRSSEERSSKQGFQFSSLENKIANKPEEIRSAEKTTKPKETNLKQNLDELVKQARFDIVQNGKSSAEIVMNPKEYGRLTLKVTVDGDKVEGRILVESEELQKSLQNEINTIKENLKESGLDLQALIIDLWDDGSGLTDRKEQNELYQTMVEAARFRNSENSVGLDESTDLLGPPTFEETKALEFFA